MKPFVKPLVKPPVKPPVKPSVKPLVLMWFTGMTCSECCPEEHKFIDELVRIIGKKIKSPGFTAICHAAPLNDEKIHKWAKYKPEGGVGDNDTCNVANLREELDKSAEHLYKYVTDENIYLFCGTSNGCIPAYEFAKHYANINKDIVLGCILHNGCPAMANTEFEVQRSWVPFPTLMLLGKQDYYWKNHQNTYRAAYVLGAAVLPFNGNHSDLPPVDACGDAFRAVLKTHNIMSSKNYNRNLLEEENNAHLPPPPHLPPHLPSHLPPHHPRPPARPHLLPAPLPPAPLPPAPLPPAPLSSSPLKIRRSPSTSLERKRRRK